MTKHRLSWVVSGALILSVPGLVGAQTGPGKAAEAGQPPARRGAYETYVPLLEREAPEPSFLNAAPAAGEQATAEEQARGSVPQGHHAHHRPQEASR